jgi:SAM-dependent methyltransferase
MRRGNTLIRIQSRCVVLALVAASLALSACQGRDKNQAEAEKLATLLDWKPGRVVAEIGAGDGRITLLAAERVGSTGLVYSTELDPEKLAKLQSLAANKNLLNIVVVKAGIADTNLPPSCCDSVFMRNVYHHFTQPTKIDASLLRSLKPGGKLAVIDFPPGKMRAFSPVRNVPKNRGGHGIPQKVLIDELAAAGFQVVSVPADWPGSGYCAVFRKPSQ